MYSVLYEGTTFTSTLYCNPTSCLFKHEHDIEFSIARLDHNALRKLQVKYNQCNCTVDPTREAHTAHVLQNDNNIVTNHHITPHLSYFLYNLTEIMERLENRRTMNKL